MANFTGTTITNKGLNLLAKAVGGALLTFTRLALGDGIWPEPHNPAEMTSLVSERHSLQIQNIEVIGNGTARIRAVFLNSALQSGFFARELGIFAQDPEEGEILYAVSYAGDQADYLPPSGNIVIESIIDVLVIVSTADNVTVWINDTVVLATKRDIIDHNESLTAHQNIQNQIQSHKNSPDEHLIPQQIAYAIQNHEHMQYTKKYLHTQQSSQAEWDILHNLGATYCIVKTYSESSETVYLDGYCGSGAYCGQQDIYCGGGVEMQAIKLTDIAYSDILVISQNRLKIRFNASQQGKAIIIGGV